MPRFTGGTLAGDVLLDGAQHRRPPPRERAHVIGYVGQDPAAGFVTDTVEEELAYGMEQLGLPPDTMRRRVEETLDLLGIADLRARDLRTLSGGQQQRVAIGSVLTMHPRLLVLDEPTSALDPTAAEEVLATLTRLVHDLGRLGAARRAPARAGGAVRRPDVPADRRRPGRGRRAGRAAGRLARRAADRRARPGRRLVAAAADGPRRRAAWRRATRDRLAGPARRPIRALVGRAAGVLEPPALTRRARPHRRGARASSSTSAAAGSPR